MNKEFLAQLAHKRWDLAFNGESGIMQKLIYPQTIALEGSVDTQVKQLREGGFSEIVDEIVIKIEEAPEVRRVPFVISDASVDRHDDTCDPDGWMLKYYQNTVLWGHDHSILPVAKALKTWKYGGQLKSFAEFTPKELNPHGWAVGELVAAKFIQSCSVGFIPHEGQVNEERTGDSWWPSMDFTKQELIEWSVVNVGSNRNALAEGRHFEEAKEIFAEKEIIPPKLAVKDVYSTRPLSADELESLEQFAKREMLNG